MNLSNLKRLFGDLGCKRVYAKTLAANDNSKNQVYLGGDYEILNILPIGEIVTEPAGNWERERLKAKLEFYWLNNEGHKYIAPSSQLILYPKYPEVRFSGFLSNCENSPSELMTQRTPGRILFLGIGANRETFGFVIGPDSEISQEFNRTLISDEVGVFKVIDLFENDNKSKLISELRRISNLEWINSKRLNSSGLILDCTSPNCGGYTLEAELGIIPNGRAEPDYLGWEIKQYNVPNFERIESSVLTLMTPEPTAGLYVEEGVDYFISNYGYADLTGRVDRFNFGGIHKVGEPHDRTRLKLELLGFDKVLGKIRNVDGMIALIDSAGIIAAGWNFSSLLKHWNKKHHQACYVPSMSLVGNERKYRYGSKVLLGEGTDFLLFLEQMVLGNIYYDPGIKMENVSTTRIIKRRSQFRMKSKFLKNLYKNSSYIDVM
jgi:hypothetical protein